MADNPEPQDALRAALARLAQADLPEILQDARSRARTRARSLIEEALVDELLRAATQAPDPSAQRTETPRRPTTAVTQPDNEPELGEAWWAYCILAAAERDAVPVGAPGIEPGTEVTMIEQGPLVAVVSPVPLSEFSDERLREHLNDIEWVERVARAHERLLDQALAGATILPLRLCTLYRDQEGVSRMLREQEPTLSNTLAELHGRREWGAKVFVDRDRLALALDDAPEPDAPSQSSGAQYMARLGRERRASERVQDFGDAVVQDIHAQLEGVADQAKANPVQRPELHGRPEQMLLNAAYLVSREREQELRQVADSLRERWIQSGIEFELTGPWPAYNFVSPSAMVAP